MSAVLGLRGTGQFGTDFRPTNYRELFTLLEPNGAAPLNALLSMTQSQETDDPKYNHFRDELPAQVLRADVGQTNVLTTLTFTSTNDINFVVANTILVNTRTSEVVRAVANGVTGSPASVAVVRGQAGSTAAAILTSDVWIIAGFADTEGAGKPGSVSFDPTTDFNYTQIFKDGVSITGTSAETFLRTGDKESELVTKALKLHIGKIERSMFWGRRFEENGSSATPRRYTGGLFNMIPNVTDAASGFATANTITENEFDRLLIENVFAWGNKQKIMFAGPRVISNLQKIAKGRWSPTSVDGAYGVGLTRYSTFAGDLLVYLHPLFRQIPGMDSTAILLDLPFIKYRYMKGRDTQLKRDVQANDIDGKEHYYMTECGLELTQGKPHTVIRNWQAA
jgi:hypothetical protein